MTDWEKQLREKDMYLYIKLPFKISVGFDAEARK